MLVITSFFKWEMGRLLLVAKEVGRTAEKYVCCGQPFILSSDMLAKQDI